MSRSMPRVSDGITDTDISVAYGVENHIIEIRSAGTLTSLWPVGTYTARIWGDWGASADIEDEVFLTIALTVRAAL